MNKYKLISLMSLLFVSISCFGQSHQTVSEERVVVLIDDQAIVATLDTTGAVEEKVLDIPSYFDDDFDDAYYVALSYKTDSAKRKKQTITIETITSIDTTRIEAKQ